MAGEAAAATKQSLECALGRKVCAGELYAAHFLGESGAKRLITLNEQHSGARADLAFPDAAKANRNVFYHADGRAKTVGEVHAWAMGEHDAPPAPAEPRLVVASETPRARTRRQHRPRRRAPFVTMQTISSELRSTARASCSPAIRLQTTHLCCRVRR